MKAMDADAAAGGTMGSSKKVVLEDSSPETRVRKPGRTGSGKMILPKMPKVPKVPTALTGHQDSELKGEPPAAPPADAFALPEPPARRWSKSMASSSHKDKAEEDLDQIDVQAVGRSSNGLEAWGMPKGLTEEESWLLKEVWAARLRTTPSNELVTPRLFTAEEVAQAAVILAKKWRHETRMRRLGLFLVACIFIGPALFGLLYGAAVAGSPSQVDDTGVLRKRSTGYPVKLGTVLEAAPLSDIWGMPVDQLRLLDAVVLREDRGRPGQMVMKVLHLHRSSDGQVILHFARNETMVIRSPPSGVHMRWRPPVQEEVLDIAYVDSATSTHALFQVMATTDVG
jgi:hypothetical protein